MHPNKHIREAIQQAIDRGWRYDAGGKRHRKGTLLCHQASRDGCKIAIYGTPSNPENHAKQIRYKVLQCPH